MSDSECEGLEDLVTIEEDLKHDPENELLLELARRQKVELVIEYFEEELQDDTRMEKYMIDFDISALVNWHLHFLRNFKTMEKLFEEDYIKNHWDYSIFQDIMEIVLECTMPNLDPTKSFSEQMEPFYRKCDVMIEKYVGDISFNKKRYNLAIKKYEDALKYTIDDNDYIQFRATLHNKIAECYSRLEKGDNHKYDYEDDSKCAKLEMKWLLMGAEHFLEKKNFKEALRCSSIMLQKNSFSDNAHKIKATALKNLNQEKWSAGKAIGNNYFREKKYKEAIKKYEDVIERCGSDITLFNNIATCYFKLGQEDSKNFVISRAMAVKALNSSQGMHRVPSFFNADHKDISKAMARIGMCYESEKDIEKAIEWFKKSVAYYPDKLLSTRILKLQKSVPQRDPCWCCENPFKKKPTTDNVGSRNPRFG